jgi:transcriptional regulator with XRE-family HTH domain
MKGRRGKRKAAAPFSEQLRAIVVRRGLTAKELGDGTGKHASVFSRWLRQQRSISMPTADAVWILLDLTIAEHN